MLVATHGQHNHLSLASNLDGLGNTLTILCGIAGHHFVDPPGTPNSNLATLVIKDIDRITGIRVSWAGLPVAEAATGDWFEIQLQIRAHADPVPARARVEQEEDGQRLVVELEEPLKGVAPGQTAVMYQETRVLGQATIDTARSKNYQPA